MSKELIAPAKGALRQASLALETLLAIGPAPKNLKDSGEAINAWSQLLIYGNRVYTKLEQASKISSKGSSWYSSVKHVRKTDPLLTYMQHARNADEHTLARIVHSYGGSFHLTVPRHLVGPGMPIIKLDPTGGGDHQPGHPDIKISKASEPRLILHPVTDRGRVYPVPTEHNGQAIGEANLQNLGTLFVASLKQLVIEAEENI